MAEQIVTGLEPVRRKKGWFELTVKGKPPFYIDEETIYKNSLKVGVIFSESRLKQVKEEADKAWLKLRALDILSRRMISERELRRKLAAERKPAALRDEVISQLKQYGYIDDFKYACSYIKSQISSGGKSRLYLRNKLYEKGIDFGTIESAIEIELAAYDEDQFVLELAKKKLKSLKGETTIKTKQKLAAYLRGKGFRWDPINKAISAVLKNNAEPD